MRTLIVRRWYRTILLIMLFAVLTVASAEEIRCVIDWSGGEVVVVPESRINDGYCDCLDTGADETETNACAGVSGWAGNSVASREPSSKKTATFFQCPQQPDLKIPVSRVNDGVCDCCDGADETTASSSENVCDDDCAAIFAAQAQRLAALRERYELGSRQRHAALREFVEFATETKRQIEQTSNELQSKQQALELARTQFDVAKTNYMQTRIDRIAAASLQTTSTVVLYNALSVSELQWLIVHACQSAGEMERHHNTEDGGSSNTKTCVPLRLAGLDVGAMWESGTYKFRYNNDENNETTTKTDIANLLYHNSQQDVDIVWNVADLQTNTSPKKKKPDKKRRRLTAEEDYDYDDFEDEYDEYINDDEYDYEEEEMRRQPKHQSSSDSDDNDDGVPKDNSKRDELVQLIRQQNFSASRVVLLDKAAAVIELIDKATREEEEAKENEEEAEEEEKKEEEDDEKPSEIDPMVFPMVRNKLERKKKLIERGLDYAVSAKVLLDAVEESLTRNEDDDVKKELLYRLAIGTLNHGELSAAQFYRILVAVIPELQTEQDSQTCSTSAAICPPRSVQRKGVEIPSTKVIEAVETFCASELAKTQPDDATTCGAAASFGSAGPEEIPTDVPDGYYGYFEIHPRAEDDFFSETFRDLGFAAIRDEATTREIAVTMEKEVERLDEEVGDLQSNLKDLEESLGGDNRDKFGPDGELHALRDECFSIEAGKYEYEVCMFGLATQKDKGSKSGGTNLGQWKEATTETVTDNDQEFQQRVWKWENGTKCWNGPKRSATVLVTCGAENKVLSADEPDTCRYVLEMESPIACDDAFRSRHGL